AAGRRPARASPRPGPPALPRRPRRTSRRGCRCSRAEVDHTADPILRLHQVEAAVDLVETQTMTEQGLDVDLAAEPAVDELRYLGAPLDAAERRPGHAAPGDQEAWDDLEQLALARDPAQRREPPGLARRLHRLAHDGDVACRLERVVGAEAVRLVA